MSSKKIPFILAGTAALCWAGNFVIGKAFSSDIAPVEMNFWRWTIALILLFPIVAKDLFKHKQTILENLKPLFFLGLTGIALYHCIVYISLGTTQAINATVINSMVPMIIPLITGIFMGKLISERAAGGILISFVGVLTIISNGDLMSLVKLEFVMGDLLMLCAAITWSTFTVLLSKRPQLPPLLFLFLISTIGVLIMLPFQIYQVINHGMFELNTDNLLTLAYLGVFAAIVATHCWNKAVGLMGPNTTGLFAHLIPVFGSLMAVAFLGETFALFHAAGIALIGAGIYLNVTEKGKS